MSINAFFNEEIKDKILLELGNAQRSIYAAIAFFTDTDYLEILQDKIENGLIVHLVVDEEYFKETMFTEIFDKNRKSEPKQILEILEEWTSRNIVTNNENALIYYYKPFDSKSGMMHHKFCIIDTEVLITGSFNWTYSAANRNKENILIIKNNTILINEYNAEFEQLQNQSLLKRLSESKFEFDSLNKSNEFIYQSSKIYIWERDKNIDIGEFLNGMISWVDFNVIEELVIFNFKKIRVDNNSNTPDQVICNFESESMDKLVDVMKKRFYKKKKRLYLINLFEIIRLTTFEKFESIAEEGEFYRMFKRVIYDLRKYSRTLNAIIWVVYIENPSDLIELKNFTRKDEIFDEIGDYLME